MGDMSKDHELRDLLIGLAIMAVVILGAFWITRGDSPPNAGQAPTCEQYGNC